MALEIEVSGAPLTRIDFGAAGVAEIVQNVRAILATPKGAVVLDREFGTDWAFVDQPQPRARQRAIAEIALAVERYEPRVRVVAVRFEAVETTDAMDGRLAPVVRLTLDV